LAKWVHPRTTHTNGSNKSKYGRPTGWITSANVAASAAYISRSRNAIRDVCSAFSASYSAR
jgi:hypothetical protein